MAKKPTKKPATGEKPTQYKPPVSIPLEFKDAVRGLMQVDPKKLPSKQAAAAKKTDAKKKG
jgi:hypothetical protein